MILPLSYVLIRMKDMLVNVYYMKCVNDNFAIKKPARNSTGKKITGKIYKSHLSGQRSL